MIYNYVRISNCGTTIRFESNFRTCKFPKCSLCVLMLSITTENQQTFFMTLTRTCERVVYDERKFILKKNCTYVRIWYCVTLFLFDEVRFYLKKSLQSGCRRVNRFSINIFIRSVWRGIKNNFNIYFFNILIFFWWHQQTQKISSSFPEIFCLRIFFTQLSNFYLTFSR